MAPIGFSVVILNLQIKTATCLRMMNDVSHLYSCLSTIYLLNMFSDISHRYVKCSWCILTWSVCSFLVLQTVWKGDSRWQRGKMSHRYSTGPRSRHTISDEACATQRIYTCLDAIHKKTHRCLFKLLSTVLRLFFNNLNCAIFSLSTRGNTRSNRAALRH